MGASIIFTIGGAICAVAFNKPILFAGRVLHGFAIGKLIFFQSLSFFNIRFNQRFGANSALIYPM